MNQDRQPIFFIGMGRSGSTVLFEAFSYHRDLGWFSNYLSRFPHLKAINLLARVFKNKRGEKIQRRSANFFMKRLPKATEAYSIWEHLVGAKFRFSFLREVVPTETEIQKTREYISQMVSYQGKKRFCGKITGPPRINFLNHIFPDAYFIDLVRDPRAVVASQLSLDFWKKREGFTKPIWEDALDEESLKIWQAHEKSPVALAALQWGTVYQQSQEEKQKISGRYLMVQYETFAEDPVKTIENIFRFVGLKPSDPMVEYVKNKKYRNMNYKYLEQLSKDEIAVIESILNKEMKEMGYI